MRTLVVPYLLWTALAGGLLFAVYKVAGLERYSIVSEKVGIFLEQGVLGWLLSSPAFQLWYIADLFKLVIISPIIYWLVKKCKLFPIIVFGILWLFEISFIINGEGLLFFTIGAYLAVNQVRFSGMEGIKDTVLDQDKFKRNTNLLTILWVAGCFFYAIFSATMGEAAYITYVLLILYKINVLTGLVSVWRLYDLNAGKWQEKKWVKNVTTCTVMVYVAHEPLQHLLTDILLEKLTFNGAHTLVYFALPIVIICVSVGLGLLLKKICPRVYGVLLGGRG